MVRFEKTHPVIIFVVIDVIRCQRCLRKRALKAKLYRSLQRGKGTRLESDTDFNLSLKDKMIQVKGR